MVLSVKGLLNTRAVRFVPLELMAMLQWWSCKITGNKIWDLLAARITLLYKLWSEETLGAQHVRAICNCKGTAKEPQASPWVGIMKIKGGQLKTALPACCSQQGTAANQQKCHVDIAAGYLHLWSSGAICSVWAFKVIGWVTRRTEWC